MKIWLADLTYTQQTIASDSMPAAIGGIASYLKKNFCDQLEVKIFKFPEDLSQAFEKDCPNVMAFSNYVWNAKLSYNYAKAIKAHFPQVVTVFGGPNFPTDAAEQEVFLRSRPLIDFYIVKEAELAFYQLVTYLYKIGFDLNQFLEPLPNLTYLKKDGTFFTSPKLDRVTDLSHIPSPYVTGELDAFFDGRLLPIVQTNRGCPFTCAFCTEGQSYWSKVNYKPESYMRDELYYIAEKLNQVPANVRRSDLLIADSNFGMYAGDLVTCKVIGEIQEKYDYPKYINVATGKNKKEQVLEAAKLVNGAMKLAGSVQSLDPTVMKNIKRGNISAEQIIEMAIKSAEIGTNTYSEVILALPGDTKEAHFKTLETLVNANFNTICMYQLMLLPGTELGSQDARQKYEMFLKFRVIPRSFGYFKFLNQEIVSAEIEEICVQNNTLLYEDYLNCRKMNLIVNVFYNDGVFSEIIKLLKMVHISPWEWMLQLCNHVYSNEFEVFVAHFIEETKNELWDKYEDLEQETTKKEIIQKYITGELGSNLIFKYKALAMTHFFEPVRVVALNSVLDLLSKHEKTTPEDLQSANPKQSDVVQFAKEIIEYNSLRIADIFSDTTSIREGKFNFHVVEFSNTVQPKVLEDYKLMEPVWISFEHNTEQKDMIESYIRLFGNDIQGLTRILSRIFLKKFFRAVNIKAQPIIPRKTQNAVYSY